MSNKGGWYQGEYIPDFPEKCLNKGTIQYRSSWEKRMLHFLDHQPNCIKYGYEIIKIPYHSEVDGRMHEYIVDFYAVMKEVKGTVKKYLIEIKPDDQTKRPVMPKKRSEKSMKNFLYEARQYIINQNKWKYAQSYCNQNGFIFKLITQKSLH
jgi:hypothetical protein